MSENYLVFTGRPNAGKSSVIKAVTDLKVIIGKDPGTTSRIELYKIAPSLILADMPGYGRSLRASHNIEEQIKDRILEFLEEKARNIILAVHVLNITTFIETMSRLDKKGFVPIDVEMVHFLKRDLGIPTLVVANKIDKGGDEEIDDNLEALKEELGPSIQVFPVSARTGYGIGSLKEEIRHQLKEKGYKNPFELVR